MWIKWEYFYENVISLLQVIAQSPTCELQILNATPEQIAQLQDTQEIILSEEQILAQSEVSFIILAVVLVSVTVFHVSYCFTF